MADKLIRNFTTTTTSPAADDYLALDGATNNTRKILADKFATTANALLVANDLSDVNDAATSRDNLGVDSSDEVAESTGTKLVSPSLSFDGSNDFLEIADSSKLSFTDETDDLPFSVGAWVKMEDATSFPVISKFGTSAALSEWVLDTHTDDKLRLRLQSTSSILNDAIAKTDVALTAYEGKWVHIAATYSAESAFGSAQDDIVLYVNGQAVAITASTDGDYEGMSDTGQPVQIGKSGGSLYANGFIKEVKLFNRELTASEVVDSMNGDLGFADEWGGALGGVYSSNFTFDSTNSLSPTRVTLDATQTIGSDSDNVKVTTDSGSGSKIISRTNSLPASGKRYRVSLDYYHDSTNVFVDAFIINNNAASGGDIISGLTSDAWTRVSVENVSSSTTFQIKLMDGASQSFTGNATDYIAFRNIKVTEIGTLADFRAERYDDSTGKIYDISDNGFIGTSANLPSLVGREIPVYTPRVAWTPTITFGGGSTGLTTSAAYGYYTRHGNLVTAIGRMVFTAKGSSTGTAQVSLPVASDNIEDSYQGGLVVEAANLASLASQPSLRIDDNASTATFKDWGGSGTANLDDTNFTDTTIISFSFTYQIQ